MAAVFLWAPYHKATAPAILIVDPCKQCKM